jgi:hypothetical protein
MAYIFVLPAEEGRRVAREIRSLDMLVIIYFAEAHCRTQGKRIVYLHKVASIEAMGIRNWGRIQMQHRKLLRTHNT